MTGDLTTLVALVNCLGGGARTGAEHLAPEDQPAHLLAVLAAEEQAAALDLLYAGLRDGTFTHQNWPGPVGGDTWTEKNNDAAQQAAAALDTARGALAELRGGTS
jgi:hypothetical protein